MLYGKIKGALVKHLSKEVDLEDIFTVIDGLIDFGIERLGTLSVYLLDRYVSNISKLSEDDISICKSLRDIFHEFVRSKCQIPSESFGNIHNVYKDLFNSICNKTTSTGSAVDMWADDHRYCTSWSIFTTNYDTCLESYFTRAHVPFGSGFRFDVVRRAMVLDTQFFYQKDDSNELMLVKLHGSINWLVENDGVVTENTTAPTRTYLGQSYVGDMMIYPVQQKELYAEPYISMLVRLHRELIKKSTWVVIGYSFSDPVILDMFVRNSNKDKHLILVHPHSSDLLSKKLDNMNCKKITPLHGYFGRNLDYITMNHSIADNCVIQGI